MTSGALRADRKVVTDLHLALLRLVGTAGKRYAVTDLRLEGGTALAAYHFGHRESEGLDFFTDPDSNIPDFARFVSAMAPDHGLELRRAGPSSRGFVRLLGSSAASEGGATVRGEVGLDPPRA